MNKSVKIPVEKSDAVFLYDNILFNNANDMIQFCSLDGRISRVNRKWREIMGYSEKEAEHLSVEDIVDIEYKEKCIALFKNVILGNRINAHNTVFKNRDGDKIDVEISASPVYIDGELKFAMAIIRDIRIRKHMEKELKSTNDELIRYIENAPIGIVFLNKKCTILRVNNEFREISGYSEEELTEKNGKELFSGKLVDSIKNISSDFNQKGMAKILKSNKTSIDIGYNMTLVNNGNVMVFCKELTEEIAITKKLKDALKMNEKILKDMPVGMMIVGMDKTIRMINEQGLMITGYSEDELIGESCNGLVCTATCDSCPVIDLKQSVDNSEKVIINKSGIAVPVIKTVIPVHFENEEVLLEAFIDVTEQTRANEQLKEQSTLNELRAEIWSSAMDFVGREELVKNILQILRKHLEAESYSFAEIDSERKVFIIKHEDNKPGMKSSIGLEIPGRIMEIYGEYKVVNIEYGKIPEEIEDIIKPIMDEYELKTILTVPIGGINNRINNIKGFITAESREKKEWNEYEINTLQEVAKITELRINQIEYSNKLKESEENYKGIFNNLHDIYFRTDIKGIITMISPSVQKITGYKPEEVIGKNASIFYRTPNSRKKLSRELQKNGSVENYEIEMTSKNGKNLFMTANAHFVGTSVEVGYIEGTFNDITHLKEIENELRASKKRQNLHFQNTPLAVIEWDTDMTVISWNPAAEKIFGYSADETLGQNINDIIIPEDIKKNIGDFKNQLLNGKTAHKINNNLTKSGKLITCEWYNTPLTNDDGNVIGVASAGTDITERVIMEKHLRQLSKAVAQSPVSIVITDTEGLIEYVNPKFTEITGYSAEEALGENPRILKADDKSEQDYKELWDTIKGDRIWKGEFKNKKKDGTIFWESASISPIKDSEDVITHFVAVKEDITVKKMNDALLSEAHRELKNVNRELQRNIDIANQFTLEAEMANSAKTRFLANMSHEIRTPMNGIIGMTGLLLDTELNNEQKDYTKIIQNSSDSLLTIINDILDFSKIEAGRVELEEMNYNLRTILEEMNDIVAVNAQEKGIEYTYYIDNTIPDNIRGDSGRLRQVLINLTGNAIKFTKAGYVELLVEGRESESDKQGIRFTVRDTGIGIPANKIEKVFDSFTQADASTTRQFGGTGLGLAISKQLIELMGGELKVRSIVNQGSSFWFDLDIRKGEATDSEPLEDMLAGLENTRLLHVDDNDTNRRLISALFNKWGLEFMEAPDGESALRIIKNEYSHNRKFDIILTDMVMPEIDGIMLAEKIRNELGISTPPILLMTSIAVSNKNGRIKKMGFDALVTKPIKQEALLETIRTATGKVSHITDHKETLENKKISRTINVLIAEDNITNQKVAVMVLRKLGYNALCVNNGIEAVDIVNTMPFDLVLMDLQMPEMDGYEATKKIRQQLGNTIPIIAMSADVMKGTKETCIKAGMDDYISKPVKLEELDTVIQKWTNMPVMQNISLEIIEETQIELNIEELKRRVGDNNEFINELMKVYIEESEQIIGDLKKYLKENNWNMMAKLAHKLKGASSSICADRIFSSVKRLEVSVKEQNHERTKEEYNILAEVFAELKAVIEEEIWKS